MKKAMNDLLEKYQLLDLLNKVRELKYFKKDYIIALVAKALSAIANFLRRWRFLAIIIIAFDLVGLACLQMRQQFFLCDVISNFALLFFFFSLANLIPLYSLFEKRIFFAIQSLIILSIGFYTTEYFSRAPLQELHKSEKPLVISCHNVLSSNRYKGDFIEDILAEKPDVLGLLEINQSWIKALDQAPTFRKLYPYKLECPRDDNFGIALYSRQPLKMEVKYSTSHYLPWILAHYSQEGFDFNLALIHTLPPISPANWQNSFRFLEDVLSFTNPNNFLVMGDFNATPNSAIYKKFVEQSQLLACGSALIPTWGPRQALLQLDHIFIGKDLKVSDSFTGPMNGSDHKRIGVAIAPAK